MFAQGECQPIPFQVRFEFQNCVLRLGETFQIPHLNLKESQVSENLDILGINSQGLFIGLDGFVVVSFGAIDEAVDVPTNVRSIVVCVAMI